MKKWHVFAIVNGEKLHIATIRSEGLVNLFLLRFADIYPDMTVERA